ADRGRKRWEGGMTQERDRTTLIGRPVDRVDGRLKVTGGARYAAEFPTQNVAYGVLVMSTIASGRILAIDTEAADRAPGVLAVITHLNAPRLPFPEQRGATDPVFGRHLR